MRPFLKGFTNELLKIAAFPQQHQDDGAYDGASSISKSMTSPRGKDPVATPFAPTKRAPTPLTIPNQMINGSVQQ